MWIVSLLVPVTAIVQVGGGVLQGAQDFDYQVKKERREEGTRESELFPLLSRMFLYEQSKGPHVLEIFAPVSLSPQTYRHVSWGSAF